MIETQTTLAILAGGEGARMGLAKSLLKLGDVPILDYLLDRFAWTGPTLLVTTPGREHPPGHQRFNHEAVDPVAGVGPLRGVLTALENCKSTHLLIATVDMPLLEAGHLRWIINQLDHSHEALGLMLKHDDQIEPFPLALRITAAQPIAQHLQTGRRSVHSLLTQPGFLSTESPPQWPPTTWTNLNFPSVLENLVL